MASFVPASPLHVDVRLGIGNTEAVIGQVEVPFKARNGTPANGEVEVFLTFDNPSFTNNLAGLLRSVADHLEREQRFGASESSRHPS
jgi:hypothetical protein